MAPKYVSNANKLARRILKASTKGPAGQKLTLPIIESWLYGELPDAIGHAIRLGWLTYEGAWLVTAAGEEVGRPSRAGVKTKRKRL
jgi:hypothetical protein